MDTVPSPDKNYSVSVYLRAYFKTLGWLFLVFFLLIAPYTAIWLYSSGDLAVERVTEVQGSGQFAIFGSGISQDFIDYKLRLYAAVKPEIVAIGSSRVMQFRGAWFRRSFLNMGGVAGNLAALRATLKAMLPIHKPKAIIIGLDFWWFLPQWESDPEELFEPASGSYASSLANLRKPWEWLLTGKITPGELLAPLTGIFGNGFQADRFGIMAQQTSNGFGPDGSWYYTAEITGSKPSLDYRLSDTLQNIRNGTRAFYHATKNQDGPAESHLSVLAEIFCMLKSRGILIFPFIPPVAPAALTQMSRDAYPHLFKLRHALAEMGIESMDLTDAKNIASTDCEFIDGFHGGDVTYARILRHLADHWPSLLPYVNMEKLDGVIRDWQGFAFAPDRKIAHSPEVDFLGLACPKTPRAGLK